MELTEFLLARVAEDEAWARDAWAEQSHAGGCDTCGAAFPRALAECEAKRRLVESYRRDVSGTPSVDAFWYALVCCALPYADHPDCDPEWKP